MPLLNPADNKWRPKKAGSCCSSGNDHPQSITRHNGESYLTISKRQTSFCLMLPFLPFSIGLQSLNRHFQVAPMPRHETLEDQISDPRFSIARSFELSFCCCCDQEWTATAASSCRLCNVSSTYHCLTRRTNARRGRRVSRFKLPACRVAIPYSQARDSLISSI